MNVAKRLTFITSSMGTKWQAFSQALLRLHFPECTRIVIDGGKNWDPMYFVSVGENIETEYIALVDEDCFVLDRAQLLEVVGDMDAKPRVAVTATPDGGTFHRDYNPVACNCFFVVIRTECLKAATSLPGWKDLTFDSVQALADHTHVERLDQARVDYRKHEPYYPFFWAVLASGYGIQYLVPSLDTRLLASVIRVEEAPTPLAIHMWWLRRWFSRDVDPYMKMANVVRYQRLENEVLSPLFAGGRNNIVLRSEQFRRIAARTMSRMYSNLRYVGRQ